MRIRILIATILAIFLCTQWVSVDAIHISQVRSYNNIPVFYHCKPLHHYQSLGIITRNTLVSHLEQGFYYYTSEASKTDKGNLGIIINDISKGADRIEVIKFQASDQHTDTAVWVAPIFLCARPVHPYRIIGTIMNRHKVPSLNDRLDYYYSLAREQYPNASGIILNDIKYDFTVDEIQVIQWDN
jgi:hypothetical protein